MAALCDTVRTPNNAPSPSSLLQAELVGRLQQLVETKAGRRIVYQQKEEGQA